jgi:AIPR protein
MSDSPLKLKFRDELRDGYQKKHHNSFDTLNAKQQSLQLATFFINEIFNSNFYQISEDDLRDGRVDGSNDLGCDFIYVDQGNVLIIQAKYRKSKTKEKINDIEEFRSIIDRLRNDKLKANKFLQSKREEIDWEKDNFNFIFIALSDIDNNVRETAEMDINYPKDIEDLSERCRWDFHDEQQLNELYRAVKSPKKNTKTIDLYPLGKKGSRGDSSVQIFESAGIKSCILILDAGQIEQAYNNFKDSLFSLNIRNYIGNTKVNREIISTSLDDPDKFFMFNNGVSCLATRVDIHPEKISVTGLQVINGAQTVKALVESSKKAKKGADWKSSKPHVLVRITEIEENYGGEGKFRERITRYNNTQNIIKVSDFKTNDSIHDALKKQFSNCHYSGKEVHYIAKRTDDRKPNSEIIKMDDFAKSVYTFLFDYTDFSNSATFLYDDSQNGGYLKVFGDNDKLLEKYSEEQFRLYAGMYWFIKEISDYLKIHRNDIIETDNNGWKALERKWIVAFCAAEIIKAMHPNDEWKNQILSLWRGDAKIKQGKKGDALFKFYQASTKIVKDVYKNSAEYQEKFEHRRWMRGKDTPRKIRDKVKTEFSSGDESDKIFFTLN